MGSVNYLLLPKSKVALEVVRGSNSDLQTNTRSSFEEFMEYMEEDEQSLDVINYLYHKVYPTNVIELVFAIVREWFNDDEAVVVTEEQVPKDYIKVYRR
jgi:hypothetical protein